MVIGEGFMLKSWSRRRVSLNKRDKSCMTSLDRVKFKMISSGMETLASISNTQDAELDFLINATLYVGFLELIQLCTTPVPENVRGNLGKPPPMNFHNMNLLLQGLGMECSTRFRFQSFEDMNSLLVCFRFPHSIMLRNKSKCSREEMLLIALSRLHYPCRWSDLFIYFPGRSATFLCRAFYWFLDFLIYNWGYLLVNNMEFWKPYLSLSCEAIRIKLQNLNYPEWRQFHPPAGEPNGFDVALFIDNTIVAMCRPGGNTQEGPSAPRVPLEVQQAWWTGWKKLHGLKFQTVMLANGMDFQVFGPLSCRRNDLTSLTLSNFVRLLATLQENEPIQYAPFGDSAYEDIDGMKSGGGRGMASVRESIEWSYKDLKTMWKYMDYKHVLKLRGQSVGKIVFICMLLRNAHLTIYGSQINEHFVMLPPSLKEWTSQGPRARPLPDNCIWSDRYRAEDYYSDETEDEN